MTVNGSCPDLLILSYPFTASSLIHFSPISIFAYSPMVMPYTTGTGCMPTKERYFLSRTGPST
jgi:hypothetical protein